MWTFAPFSNASQTASDWASLAIYLAAWPLWLATGSSWPHIAPAATGLLALWHWWRHYRRYRFVADTPTASCHHPIQGHGGYYGQARAFGGQPLLTPYGQMRCVWYHARRQRHQNSHQPVATSQCISSDSAFLLDDGKGQLVIEPEGARVEAMHHRRWQDQDHHYQESWIADGDPLYAQGSLTTEEGAPDRQAWREDLQFLLNEWKADQAALLQRFDRDGNGTLDSSEWDMARQHATDIINRQHRELAATPASHHLRKPADAHPFLLSWRTPKALARKLRLLAWSHAAVALLAGCWLARQT